MRRVEIGKADWIHIDVMDGQFVPNLTIGMPVVRGIRPQTRLPLDVHLMIVEPDRYLDEFAQAGADYITVHAEACIHLQRTLSHIRSLGKKAGVALNPATSPECLKYVLNDLDLVLIMTVNPGFGGQKFINEVMPKIRAVKDLLLEVNRTDVHLSVDGGITPDTAKVAIAAGANVLVAGNSIYGAEDPALAIAQLRQAVPYKENTARPKDAPIGTC